MDKLAFLCAANKFRSKAENIEGIGEVNIKKFTAGDVASFESRLKDLGEKFPDSHIAPWVLIGVCDEHGKPMFNEEDMPELRELPIEVVTRIVEKIFEVNKMVSKPAEAIEEAEKN